MLELLEIPSDKIEVVVSDNVSDDKTEEYMREITDKRFKYYRNAENNGFINISEVIRKGSGKFCFLIRDKDTILNVKEWFSQVENLLQENDESTIFRGTIESIYKLPNETLKRNTARAYIDAFNSSTATALIFPRKIVESVFCEAGKSLPYHWDNIPHVALMLFCVHKCDIVPMHNLTVKLRTRNIGYADPLAYTSKNKTLIVDAHTIEYRYMFSLEAAEILKKFNVPQNELVIALEHFCTIQVTVVLIYCRNTICIKHPYNVRIFGNLPLDFWNQEYWRRYLIFISRVYSMHGVSSFRLSALLVIFSWYRDMCYPVLATEEKEKLQNKKDALLSICIPTHNNPDYVYTLVQELLKIKSTKIEIIVVDSVLYSWTTKLLATLWDSRLLFYSGSSGSAVNTCLAKATGKFTLIVKEDEYIPDIEDKFSYLENLLQESNDTVVFNSGSLAIFPTKSVKQCLEMNKNCAIDNKIITMFCARFCKMVSLKNFSIQKRQKISKVKLEDLLCLPMKSDENYESWKSKKILIMDMLKLVEICNLKNEEKNSLLEKILLKQCDLIQTTFINTYRSKMGVFLKYQSYGFMYWHYEFWESLINALNKISNLYGNKTVRIDFLAKVVDKYSNFCKVITKRMSASAEI